MRELWFMVVWVSTAMFQYGYHISELNALQGVLTCTPRRDGCIPLSLASFGSVTYASRRQPH